MLEFISSAPGIVSLVGIAFLVARRFGFSPIVTKESPNDRIMQIIVSALVLLSALYVILSQNYEADTQKWAFGAVGLIVGYWLPTKA